MKRESDMVIYGTEALPYALSLLPIVQHPFALPDAPPSTYESGMEASASAAADVARVSAAAAGGAGGARRMKAGGR